MHSVGVHTGQPIVVVADRCMELVVTALAIIKCRAIYVPVDVSYPIQRINNIINDNRCEIIINLSSRNINKECKYNEIKVFSVEDINNPKNQEIMDDKSTCSVNDIAYVIYTSGTTGNPKGVMVSHKAIANTLFWMNDQFSLGENDIIAHKTSISFTDSIWEIFWPLINGAIITIINSNDAKNPKELYTWLSTQKVNYTQFVPSMLKVFIQYIRRKNISAPLPNLKYVFNGGEQISINLAKKFNEYFENAQIANIYGMTESAIYATYYIVDKQFSSETKSVAIGKPIANTKVYIINSENKLCDTNEKGEICISGVSLAAGYWNDLLLTSQKFYRSDQYPEVVYKSGDIGMIDMDGCIWYCGRKDNQIKIRGNRVEIYDVEKNILEFSGIEQVAVISQKNKYDENYLVCFLENKRVDLGPLREFLRQRLPEYMVPQYYKYINEFPLTVNNKIDKKKLKQIDDDLLIENNKSVCKVNEPMLKGQIRNIWVEILGTSTFSNNDDFYNVGGDSLSLSIMEVELEKKGIFIEYSNLIVNRSINQIYQLLKNTNN
ncbi:non-ribosomal peptide synthetase [Clostridium algidicarnis]|nr:non-ribosomal peptide synthetase [Clostridium algidicarnis]